MRSFGVRTLAVTCELCHYETMLSAERWSDAALVRDFRPRAVRDYRCRCQVELVRDICIWHRRTRVATKTLYFDEFGLYRL